MHELSIAQNILEIIQQHVPEEHLRDVRNVKLKVGVLAGVVPESLQFSYNAITTDTPLASSNIEIDLVPFVLFCRSCETTSSNEIGFVVCGKCGSSNTKILSGTELNVIEFELEDVRTEVV